MVRIADEKSCSRSQLSTSNPFKTGIFKSKNIRQGSESEAEALRRNSIAAAPSKTCSTTHSQPDCSNLQLKMKASSSESSTRRTVGIFGGFNISFGSE